MRNYELTPEDLEKFRYLLSPKNTRSDNPDEPDLDVFLQLYYDTFPEHPELEPLLVILQEVAYKHMYSLASLRYMQSELKRAHDAIIIGNEIADQTSQKGKQLIVSIYKSYQEHVDRGVITPHFAASNIANGLAFFGDATEILRTLKDEGLVDEGE